MTSGVKQPYTPPPPCAPKDDFAPGLDRLGGDYRIIMSDGPTGCCAACDTDIVCKSWTYVEADPYLGCHMKSSVVPLVNDSCVRCTSGSKWEKGCQTSNLFEKGLTYCEQPCYGWCWASSIVMVWNFFYKDYQCGKDECELVHEVRGENCCNGTDGDTPICEGACAAGSTTNDITTYLQKIEKSYIRCHALSEEQLYDAVQKFPVVIVLYLEKSPTHALVIGGVQCNSDGSHSFLIADPAKIYGMQALPYHEIISYHKIYVWGDSIASLTLQ